MVKVLSELVTLSDKSGRLTAIVAGKVYDKPLPSAKRKVLGELVSDAAVLARLEGRLTIKEFEWASRFWGPPAHDWYAPLSAR